MHQMWQSQAPRSLKNYLHEAKEKNEDQNTEK